MLTLLRAEEALTGRLSSGTDLGEGGVTERLRLRALSSDIEPFLYFDKRAGLRGEEDTVAARVLSASGGARLFALLLGGGKGSSSEESKS